MRATLDTNVFVSALVFGGALGHILDLHTDEAFVLCTSPAIMTELTRVLIERFEWEEDAVAGTLQAIFSRAEIVEPANRITASPDPDDNHILECAVESKSDIIMTADHCFWISILPAQRLDAFHAANRIKCNSYSFPRPLVRESTYMEGEPGNNFRRNRVIAIGSVLVLLLAFAFLFLYHPRTSDAAWYASGGTWLYRRQITIDHTKVSGASNLARPPSAAAGVFACSKKNRTVPKPKWAAASSRPSPTRA